MKLGHRGRIALTMTLAIAGTASLAGGIPRTALALAGHNWYVDATRGSLATTCPQNDRQHPFQTIGQAMSCVAAPPPSAPDIIHIAAGTYNENVTITGNVNLLGAGVGVTIINGVGGGSDITNHTYTVGVSGMTLTRDIATAYSGIENEGTMSLTNSAVTGFVGDIGNGGGIYNTGRMTLLNTPVTNDDAGSGNGGGIYNDGTMALNNSPVFGNAADADGGGIYNEYGSMRLTNSRVSDNDAYYGGGISNAFGGTMTLINSPVGGSHLVSGKGSAIVKTQVKVVSDPSAGNEAYGSGGLNNFDGATTTFLNSPISFNDTCTDGAGVWNGGSALALQNSNVNNNVVECGGNGGGIWTEGGPVTLKNENIFHNYAADGGGLYDAATEGSDSEPDNSTACTGFPDVSMSNTTIAHNIDDDC